MKVLLIQPPARFLKQESIVIPPLGLAYLASSVEGDGHKVKILDAFAKWLSWTEFEEEVKKEKPDVIGIGGMTPTIDLTIRAIKICRPYTPTIVVGGPHLTVYKQDFFRECPEADLGIIGEAEESFRLVLKRIEEKKDIWDIPGIVCVDKINPPNGYIENLDNLPFPARHLLSDRHYRYALWPGKKITTMITSRGCPYQCIFCDKSIFGSRWRARSPQNVVEELELVTKEFGVQSIIIYDDLFTFNKQRVMDICQGILEKGLKIEWKCEGRVDRVDFEMLKLMKKAGCSLIAYGVESANQNSLNFLKKGTTIGQIRRAFEITRQAGVRPMAYFILGIPTETYDESLKTIKFAKELDPDFAQFSILSPYKGTKLYEETKRQNWYQEVEAKNPFDKDKKRPVVISDHWSEKNLRKILRAAHKSFYFRPSYIIKKLIKVRNLQQISDLFSAGLGILRWYFSKEAS